MSWLEERLSRLGGFEPYGYSVESGRARLLAKLDANENWHVPRAKVRAAMRAASAVDPREYPDLAVGELKRRLSAFIRIPERCIVPCAGADQAIDLLCQAFLKPGDRALVVSPSFSMYRLRSAIAGAETVDVEMGPDMSLPVDQIISEARGGGLVFVCSPNNPTGNQFGEKSVRALLDSFRGLVILDEAYVEFAEFSLSGLVAEYRNLAVLRTFSKAFGLAGLRLGYALANEGWAQEFLERVQYPYPVSSAAVAAALVMLEEPSDVESWAGKVRVERSWLASRLRALGVRVTDSQANFVMVGLQCDSEAAHADLLKQGVATRNLGTAMGVPNCLRVTVGTRTMNEALLLGLERAIRHG